MIRLLALTATAALLACGTAMADETVSTAKATDAHPPAAQPAPPVTLSDGYGHRDDGGGVRMTACGPEAVDAAGVVENRPHGEVSVGAGTHGYREVGASVCQPLPNGGFVAISGGQSQVRYGH